MELTIVQALQQGIATHTKGKLKEAERLYRAILNSQPANPDANHNLGVILVSVNKADAALPLFKTAVEANPKIEQFWLSYIDALIKEKQFDKAKQVLEQAKKQGLAKEKLNTLGAQLFSEIQIQNINSTNPPQEQLSSLLEYYQNGQYDDAENLAKSITQQFPKHQFSWTILGAVLKQTGRIKESLFAKHKAVELEPLDAQAHYNLGITLQELGRLDEAEASYTKAIALKNHFAIAHYNLGITLKELGRLNEAEVSYAQAIALKPDYAEAYSNLGNSLQELGRLEEAEANYRQAIALKPDYIEAYSNLGITLKELGRLDEAEASYKQAIALKPDFSGAHNNLGNTLQELGRLDEAEASYRQAIALKPDYANAHYNLGVLLFESTKYNLAAEQFELTDILNSQLFTIKCSYLQDEETIFYEKFDLLVCQGENNAVMGSLAFRSEFKYGIKKSNPFCNDPLSYVVKTDLNALYDFKNIFIETARAVLSDNSMSYKAQGHLTNGVQTAGNIFVQGKVPKTEIENIIHTEIEKYRIQFKDSDEGFIKNWPTSYEIKGWLVCMQSGGKLAPHMHDSGWITGSIYINVPPKSNTDCGNLVLCLSDQEHVLAVEKNQQSIIDVVTGSLCLFPSSLHHYTVPFEEKEDRIVLAFDVIPKN
jgi:pentatricopeptide repeat protein